MSMLLIATPSTAMLSTSMSYRSKPYTAVPLNTSIYIVEDDPMVHMKMEYPKRNISE